MGIMTPAKHERNELRLAREQIEVDQAAVVGLAALWSERHAALDAREAAVSDLQRVMQARAEEIRVKHLATSSKLDAAAAERETVKAALKAAERAKAEAEAATLRANVEAEKFGKAAEAMANALYALNEALKATDGAES